MDTIRQMIIDALVAVARAQQAGDVGAIHAEIMRLEMLMEEDPQDRLNNGG